MDARRRFEFIEGGNGGSGALNTMIADLHLSVMPQEVVDALVLASDGIYIDCTFGRGGHSQEILRSLGASGKLLAIDKDVDAVNSQVAKMLIADSRFDLQHDDFATLRASVTQRDWAGKVSGILMDLGVSSPQLDDATRGFSFLKDADLDMRMNRSHGMTAAEWIADVTEQDLVDVLKNLGEEKFARRIAKAVVEMRQTHPLQSTLQLAELIEKTVPTREKNKHPATRSFQAIRIHINRELEQLREALAQAVDVLKPKGRLVVISFHSLEDRIVKRFIRDESIGGRFPQGMPVSDAAFSPRLIKIGKMLKPSAAEIKRNPRARSAVLRVAERLA